MVITNPKYALKKLSIGVASVAIGITLTTVAAHADATTPTDQVPINQTTAAPASEPSNDQSSIDYGHVDATQWTGKYVYDGSYELNGYTGDNNHVVIPNLNDLLNVHSDKIAINPDLLFKITGKGAETIAVSKTTGEKSSLVGVNENADNGYLRSAFGGTIDPETKQPIYNPQQTTDKNKPNYLYNTNDNIYGSHLIGIDLGNLDVSNIKNFDGMFAGLTNLQEIKGLENWNTSRGINFNSMFENARKLTALNLANWKMGSTVSLNGTFRGMLNLTSLGDLSGWDTSHVTDFANLFFNDQKLGNRNFLKNWNVSQAKTISGMFTNNQNLTKLDLTGWQTKNIKDLSYTFQNCSNLTEIKGLDQLDTSNVQNMSYLFANDWQLKSLPNIGNWNLSNATDLSYMLFNDPVYLPKIDFSHWQTDNIANLDHFATVDTNQINQIAKQVNQTAEKLRTWDNYTLTNFNTSNVVNFNSMFSGYANFKHVLDLSHFDFGKAQHMNLFIDPYVNAIIYLGHNNNLPLNGQNIFTAGNQGPKGNTPESNKSVYRLIFTNDDRLLKQNKFYNYLHITNKGTIIDNSSVASVIKPTTDYDPTNETAWLKTQTDTALNDSIKQANVTLKEHGLKIDPTTAPQTDNAIDRLNAFYNVQAIVANQDYQFIDDDLNQAKINKVITVSGQLTKTTPVHLTLPANYHLAPNQKLPTVTGVLTENNPVIQIHLVHDHADVTGQNVIDPATNQVINDHVDRIYRLIEKLPNSQEKVILRLNATIYRQTDQDKVTGKITYSNTYGTNIHNKYSHTGANPTIILDSSPNRMLVKADQIPGYHYQLIKTGHNNNRFDYSYQDGLTIFEITKNDTWAPYPGFGIQLFNKEQQMDSVPTNEDFYIEYLPNMLAGIIKYYDLQGRIVSQATFNGRYQDQVNVNTESPNGYALVNGQNKTITMNLDNNELDLLVVPVVKPIVEHKTITRTIKVIKPDGVIQTIAQQVTFTKKVTFGQQIKITTSLATRQQLLMAIQSIVHQQLALTAIAKTNLLP